MDAIEKNLGNIYVQNTHTITNLSSSKTEQELTEEEKLEVQRLKKRDAEVRAHEEAHKRTAGVLAKGAPVYKYEIGPDGKRYAVSGHVKIDTAPEDDPDETIAKAEKIKRSALAPMDPSPQDRKVAQSADRMAANARQEKISEEDLEEKQKEVDQEKQVIDPEVSYNKSGEINKIDPKGENVNQKA